MVRRLRAVAAYLKVVRRRKASSADGTRGGIAREIFDFLALLCAFLVGFYAFGTRFHSRKIRYFLAREKTEC